MLLPGIAIAGDNSAIDFIGFSQDDRYFAFEQYGVFDGSGYPYSDIFIVDTTADEIVETPRFHFESPALDEAIEPLSLVRAQNRSAARAELTKDDIETPAAVAALNGDGVDAKQRKTLSFGRPGYSAPGQVLGRYHVTLKQLPLPDTQHCQDKFGRPSTGFSVAFRGSDETGTPVTTRTIHRDEASSESRRCADAFDLYAVVVREEANDLSGAVAIIAAYEPGFETDDRRFIAVPIGGK